MFYKMLQVMIGDGGWCIETIVNAQFVASCQCMVQSLFMVFYFLMMDVQFVLGDE
jgi:hypothetical protein